MDIKIIIDKEHNEEVIIYAKEKTRLIEEIEELILQNSKEITAYNEKTAYKLTPDEIYCCTIQNNKIYAVTDTGFLQLKNRLYQIEEILGSNFIKINQSCIANIKMIKKFDASLTGNITVTFKNGYKDYVSRRCVKNVKERLGL